MMFDRKVLRSALALLGYGASRATAFGFRHAASGARLEARRDAPDSSRSEEHAETQYRQAMDNAHDLQYFAKLKLGEQDLNVVLDTGSVEFVVLSDKCEYWCGPEARLYHVNKSATYVGGDLNLILSYGSGELLGLEAYENVSIGPWAVAETAFWEVRDASMPLLFQAEWSAIIGLGPMARNTQVMRRNSLHNKKSFAILPKRLGVDRFSVCLGKEPGSQGYITWNDRTPELIPGDFLKLNVVDSGYWMLRMTDVYLGDRYLGCKSGCGVVADSGTSLLSLPALSFDLFKKMIVEMHADCDHLSVLPDLHFRLDGQPFSLPPDAYVGNVYGSKIKALETLNPARATLLEGDREGPSKEQMKCEPALMHITMDSSQGPVWILGMPFFRKYYSVFVQRGETEGPAIYTATATSDCSTANSAQSGLLGPSGNRSQRDLDIDSWSHGHVAREVDMSKVQVPAWVRRANKLGHLEENVDMAASRVIGAPEDIGPLWANAKDMAT